MKRDQLCVELGVCGQTIINWQRAGCPATKVHIEKCNMGTRWRWDFDIELVKQWLSERKKGLNDGKNERDGNRYKLQLGT